MRKGLSKQQAEEDEVLGRCIRIISTCYLDKPFPKLAQYSTNKNLDEIIELNKKNNIQLSTNEIKELIFSQGSKLKSLVEEDLLNYYLL
jgi:hypothetical protein